MVLLQPHPGRSSEPVRTGRRAARRARRAGRAGGGDPGRAAAAGGDRLIEPRLRPGFASRACRPGRRADDRGRDDRGTHEHGLAARGDADPPAVHAVRVRARARAPPRAPAAEARLPPVVHDQPRRRVARPRAGLRSLRAGARVRGAARPARLRPADRAVPRLDLRDAPRPRTGPGPRRAVGGGRFLRRADRVRRATARSTPAPSASSSCGRARCRSAATCSRRSASTRP